MFVIVDIAGFQEKVAKGEKLRVPLLEAKEGASVTFDKVYLVAKSDSDVQVGTPVVSGIAVTAKIVKHGKSDKINVVKFKKRKRYLKLGGHRQDFTEIEITDIGAGGKTVAPKAVKKTEKKTENKK